MRRLDAFDGFRRNAARGEEEYCGGLTLSGWIKEVSICKSCYVLIVCSERRAQATSAKSFAHNIGDAAVVPCAENHICLDNLEHCFEVVCMRVVREGSYD